jgi:hypothetical protein
MCKEILPLPNQERKQMETITIYSAPTAERSIPLAVRILKSVADKHGIKPRQEVSQDKALKLSQESKAVREGGARK